MTLAEITIGMGVLFAIIAVTYTIFNSSSILLAKNITLNSTNTSVRGTLDRINSEITQANDMPTLINSDGSAASGSGPAAGVVYDYYVGGPYVVTNPGINGLSAGAITMQLTLATNALALPPIPKANDVVRVSGSDLRPLVNASSPATMPGNPPALQAVAVTLKSGLSDAIPWPSGIEEKAYLVHRRALVVVTANGLNQLRLYNNVETASNSCDLTTSYTVLNQNIGNQNGDNTPFSLVTQNTKSFLSVAMRVQDQQYNYSLSTKQANQFNTFLRIDTLMRPRNFL